MIHLEAHAGPVRCLAYSPGGQTLASGDDRTVRLWDPAVGRQTAVSPDQRAAITCLAFSPDGEDLASGDSWGAVHLRDASTALCRFWCSNAPIFQTMHDHPVSALAYVAEGRRLMSVAGGPMTDDQGPEALTRQVAIWDQYRCQYRLLSGLEAVWGFGVGEAGRMLFFGSGERHLTAWPLGGALFRRWERGDRYPWLGEFTPYSQFAAGRLRHLGRWRPRAPARPRALAVSRDGRNLAAPWGRVIELWDAAWFRLRATLSGHDDDVVALAFAPDGRTLASASFDGAVRLWDFEEARLAASYDWEIGRVHCLAFAPDGMTIAAGGDLGIVVWDLDDATH